MRKSRTERRRAANAAVPVLSSDNQKIVRSVAFELALQKIARREWRAVWYETGELAGVQLQPPDTRRTDRLIYIRCGSVECLKSFRSGTRGYKPGPRAESVLALRLDLLDGETGEKLRAVSANMALMKIALGVWKPLWTVDGALAGVAKG